MEHLNSQSIQMTNELYICKNNYDICHNNILCHFSNIINKKTGLIFSCNKLNDYYIYTYENYSIIFNAYSQTWGLLNWNLVVLESKNLNEIIYKFLYDKNRLALVLYENSDIDEITNLLNDFTIKSA